MKTIRAIVWSAALLGVFASSATAAEDLKVYYGLLHAHTRFSDGSGTPAEAYTMAKGAGVQFFAVTSPPLG